MQFKSGTPKKFPVNEGDIKRVSFGQFLNEFPTEFFSKITDLIPSFFIITNM
jgi:hypothetical protein